MDDVTLEGDDDGDDDVDDVDDDDDDGERIESVRDAVKPLPSDGDDSVAATSSKSANAAALPSSYCTARCFLLEDFSSRLPSVSALPTSICFLRAVNKKCGAKGVHVSLCAGANGRTRTVGAGKHDQSSLTYI